MSAYPKRLIEVDLPIKRISAHARREKSIRHGHISTLHIWWARRPLAACRAVILAALWPDPADEGCPERFREEARARMLRWARDSARKASPESFERLNRVQKMPGVLDDLVELRKCLLDFIADFSNWDNSNDRDYLETSRALVQVAHEALGGEAGVRPLVVDPFAGGGAIPLEALRVGASAFASDLNPVAVLLNKVVLEYIPRFGQRLADEFQRLGAWVAQESEEELARYYPKRANGDVPVAYLWARTVTSDSPDDGSGIPVEIPLIRNMTIVKRGRKVVRFAWRRDKSGRVLTETLNGTGGSGGEVKVRRPLLDIVEGRPTREEPGTSRGGAATCPVTGHTMSVERVREQLVARAGGAANARLLAVASIRDGQTGRLYSLPEAVDLNGVLAAHRAFGAPDVQELLPTGELNHLRGFFNVVLYGMTRWGDLFSPRQAVGLCRLVSLARAAARRVADPDLSEAVLTCLALAIDRCADKCASVVVWDATRENVTHVFGRQALPMVWDFAEASLLSDNGWYGACEWIRRVIENVAVMKAPAGTAQRASATHQVLPDDAADAVVTDPPYYAAIPYADLSDFFYSWLKKTVGDVHPALCSSQLAPKADELVALSHRAAMYRNKDNAWFESGMREACEEARRVTKPGGVGLFVFANKETAGWEAMLSALVRSGWVITGSWPIDTELANRLRAQNSAVLASSVHLVCRPREDRDGSVRVDAVGDWRDVLAELPTRIHEWMPRLADEGVVGADAIFACLGPALEIYSRSSRVEKASGEEVTLKEYLEHVWAAVAKEALSMIFTGAETSGLEEDARLTAMWLWTVSTGDAKVEDSADDDDEPGGEEDEGTVRTLAKAGGVALSFDAARKIAQGLGAHLEDLTTLVEVKGETARLLPVAERTRALFGKDDAQAPTARRKKKAQQMKLGFAEELEEAEETGGWGQKGAPQLGQTVLDRVHQSMILFAAGRGEALRRFLVDEGAGRDGRFWRLAQALAALYPTGTDERRWVEGVLARKKGLGF